METVICILAIADRPQTAPVGLKNLPHRSYIDAMSIHPEKGSSLGSSLGMPLGHGVRVRHSFHFPFIKPGLC